MLDHRESDKDNSRDGLVESYLNEICVRPIPVVSDAINGSPVR